MPLLAYTRSGEPLIAPLLSDDAWERLKTSADRDAWMPYGKGRAIPKESRLGTRFFAHLPGQAGGGSGESEIHLYLKAQVLLGARAAGWEALPEQAGVSPEGEDWRADVLCRRAGKSWSVAVEVQVQLQVEEQYRRRQARYQASGLRTLWLVGHEHSLLNRYWLEPDRDLPAFRIHSWKDDRGRPGAHVEIDGQRLSASNFVSGALGGKLHWSGDGRHGTVLLVLRPDQCWHRTCRREVLLPVAVRSTQGRPVAFTEAETLDGYGDAYTKGKETLPDLADSPRPFRRGLASRCPHCGRSIRYHVQERSGSMLTTVPLGVHVPQRGNRFGLAPHAQWHWGSQTHWRNWARVGDIGLVEHGSQDPPSAPRRS